MKKNKAHHFNYCMFSITLLSPFSNQMFLILSNQFLSFPQAFYFFMPAHTVQEGHYLKRGKEIISIEKVNAICIIF